MRYYPREMTLWEWIKKYFYELKRDKEYPVVEQKCNACGARDVHRCSNLGLVCFDCGREQ